MGGWVQGLTLMAVSAAAFWALGRYVPGMVAQKINALFLWARSSEWMRAKPHRINLLVALVKFLEEELPEPGQGKEFYTVLGGKVAAIPGQLASTAPLFMRPALVVIAALASGSGPKWASVLEKIGDAADTELDDELKQLASTDAPPPPALS